MRASAASPAADGSSGCPVLHDAIDPSNMMPAPNQQPRSGQQLSLSQERVKSTIPRGSAEGEWVYPSEQMFYNALHRKGKADGVQEHLMNSVVAIHNNMNERAWKQVLEWESLHCAECPTPKLLRFHGRPDDLSPKARLKLAFGLVSKPFDRHDWTVDRCGKHVRYILDYYDVKAKPGEESRMPMLHDEDAVPTIEMDIRPALDSPGALYDRMRLLGRSISSMLPTMATAAASEAARSPVVAALAATEEAGSAEVEAVRKSCAKCYDALAQCENEKDCGLAQMTLKMCIAKQVCREQAGAFESMKGEHQIEKAMERLEGVESCLAEWARVQKG